jgi:hypothetical protein
VNAGRFDDLTCMLAALASRRMVGRVLAGLAVAGPLAQLGSVAVAKNDKNGKGGKKDKKHKPKKKPKFNDFDCVDVGSFCTSSRQCCSGICQGKKGKQTCQAHNAGIDKCAAGISDFCADPDGGLIAGTACTTSADEQGLCFTTTGNAPYCAGSEPEASCSPTIVPCKKDFGVKTACAGPDDSCLF